MTASLMRPPGVSDNDKPLLVPGLKDGIAARDEDKSLASSRLGQSHCPVRRGRSLTRRGRGRRVLERAKSKDSCRRSNKYGDDDIFSGIEFDPMEPVFGEWAECGKHMSCPEHNDGVGENEDAVSRECVHTYCSTYMRILT